MSVSAGPDQLGGACATAGAVGGGAARAHREHCDAAEAEQECHRSPERSGTSRGVKHGSFLGEGSGFE